MEGSTMSKNTEVASMEKHPRTARMQRFVHRPFWQRIYHVTSKDWLGNNDPPLTDKTILKYDVHFTKDTWNNEAYSIVTYVDDGHEIGFGYHDEWKLIISRKVFAKAVRSYIKIWAWDNWFGLRSWLYFKALHKIVENNKRARKS
jgi:hypothetical protein